MNQTGQTGDNKLTQLYLKSALEWSNKWGPPHGSNQAVRIISSANGRYALDYRFPTIVASAGAVELTWRGIDACAFYVALSYVDTDGLRKDVWLNVLEAEGPPFQAHRNEWNVFCPSTHIGGKWHSINVNLYRHFRKTLGRFGCEYKGLAMIRLRGKAEIASIKTKGICAPLRPIAKWLF